MSRCIWPQNTTKAGGLGGWSSITGQPRVKAVEWAQRRHALAAISGFSDSDSIKAISRESRGASTLGVGGCSVMAWSLCGGWLGSSAQARRRFFATFQKRLRVQRLLVHVSQTALRSGLGFERFEALGVRIGPALAGLPQPVVALGARQALAPAAGLRDCFAFVFGGRAVQGHNLGKVVFLRGFRLLGPQGAMVHARGQAGAFQCLVEAPGDFGAHGLDFFRACLEVVVGFGGVGTKPLRPDGAGRHQQMGMVVAVVPALVRGVDGDLDGHAVALDQQPANVPRQVAALLGVQFVRQSNDDFACHPRVFARFVGFHVCPQLRRVLCPCRRAIGRQHVHGHDSGATRVVVSQTGAWVFQCNARAVSGSGRSAVPFASGKAFYGEMENGHGSGERVFIAAPWGARNGGQRMPKAFAGCRGRSP